MELTDEDLQALFKSMESERVERKQSISDRDGICQAVCAFANDLTASGRAGVVFIGQCDDLSCANIHISDNLLRTVAGWGRDGKFQPFPVMSVGSRRIMQCEVAVMTVQPSANTPVRYDGRVGPRRAVASAEEERRLTEKRNATILPFDARGVSEATMADIDEMRFHQEYLPSAIPSDILAQNGRTQNEQMRALRLTDDHGQPTVTAILILGKSPQRLFPGAYVETLRIDGTALTDPILDHHTITGALPDQLRRLDELADIWNETSSVVGGEFREDMSAYPIAAIRQLLRNAVLHRNYETTNAPVRVTWYNDRIEIASPGGLFGSVTQETFGRPGVTDYRNPTIADALRSLGYVEKFGIGLQIAASELKRNGNSPFEIEALPSILLLVIRRRT